MERSGLNFRLVISLLAIISPVSGFSSQSFSDEEFARYNSGVQSQDPYGIKTDPDEQGFGIRDPGFIDKLHGDLGFGDEHIGDFGFRDQHHGDLGFGDVNHRDLGDKNHGDLGFGDVNHRDLGDKNHGDLRFGDVNHRDLGFRDHKFNHQSHGIHEQYPERIDHRRKLNHFPVQTHKNELEDMWSNGHYNNKQKGNYSPKKKHVPVVLKKKKKKSKVKIVSVVHGFYIPGGSRLFGKFLTLKSCQKSCEVTASCFAGDYNPWNNRCYHHGNLTACANQRSHKSIIHFKKIPCTIAESPLSLVTLGAMAFKGIYQKNIKDLSRCLKLCISSGGGIAPSPTTISTTPQICFGVDYEFENHRCYFHFDSGLCSNTDPVRTPVRLIAHPTTVNILICPLTTG